MFCPSRTRANLSDHIVGLLTPETSSFSGSDAYYFAANRMIISRNYICAPRVTESKIKQFIHEHFAVQFNASILRSSLRDNNVCGNRITVAITCAKSRDLYATIRIVACKVKLSKGIKEGLIGTIVLNITLIGDSSTYVLRPQLVINSAFLNTAWARVSRKV